MGADGAAETTHRPRNLAVVRKAVWATIPVVGAHSLTLDVPRAVEHLEGADRAVHVCEPRSASRTLTACMIDGV